jgi:hypothetical protein
MLKPKITDQHPSRANIFDVFKSFSDTGDPSSLTDNNVDGFVIFLYPGDIMEVKQLVLCSMD